jgi:hypothetical protein
MIKGPRRKPCRYCRKWFLPDSRVGERQRACSSETCQQQRRQHTQREWRARHPDYDVARRILAKCAQLAEAELPRPAPLSPLHRLPWDLAQDAMGIKASVFIEEFGKVLAAWAQDQWAIYPSENTHDFCKHGCWCSQDQIPRPP